MSELGSRFVAVPENAKITKPFFPNEPKDGEPLVVEIKAHIAETGEPFSWWGHSHTKPPQGGTPPTYISRVELPKAMRKRKQFSPCPACTPDHRKFGEGIIAWFPDESAIRIIGVDCFASIDKEGHEKALAALVRREKEQSALNHILASIAKLPLWIAAAEELLKIARAADVFYPLVVNRIMVSQRERYLWRHVRGGNLEIVVSTETLVLNPKTGELDKTTVDLSETLFTLEGHTALDPNRKPQQPKLADGATGLKAYEGLTSGMVKAMDYRKKLEVSQDLKRCIQLVKDIHAVLSSEVRFLTQVNINRFGQWARHPGSPVNFDIRRKDGHLHFDGYKPQTLPIPEDLWSPMLPTFNAPN